MRENLLKYQEAAMNIQNEKRRSFIGKAVDTVEGEVLIKSPNILPVEAKKYLLENMGLHTVNAVKLGSGYLYKFIQEDNNEILALVALGDSRFHKEYACENTIYQANAAYKQQVHNPNWTEDKNPELWGMDKIKAPKTWKDNYGNKSTVVCVIDTGIDYTHPALASNLWRNKDGSHGFNACADNFDPMDDNSHGTHCAGTIGGNGTNGLYGVCPTLRLMGAKFLSASGGGTLFDAVACLEFAKSQGVRITSNSWGGGGRDKALEEAFQSCNALHVIAAGNSSQDMDYEPSYPGSYTLDNILCVAATNERDELAYFSNYGSRDVDLGAPGVNIFSSVLNHEYNKYSGTSMACPHVAGAAALILSKYPNISIEELKHRLMNATRKVEALEGKTVTGGILDLSRLFF